jgi:ornithine carbamoyltransferase
MLDAIRDTLSPLKGRSFQALNELSPSQMNALLDLAKLVKAEPDQFRSKLKNKTWALVFEKHSTRTRVSFESGIMQLGGNSLFLSSNDIQLGRGEPISDTAKVLSRYVDGIVLRTFGQDRLAAMAEAASIPVVNALTDKYHPCQILADLQTVSEHRGSLEGKIISWIGDGNNVAHSLMLGAALTGMHFRCASPEGYDCMKGVVEEAQTIAEQTGATLAFYRDPKAAADNADVIVTDVFTSMGQEAETAERMRIFEGFCVDDALMSLAKPDALFLHCLPAHRGEEVTASVIDGPQSVVWDEAENRMHAQKALVLALGGAI